MALAGMDALPLKAIGTREVLCYLWVAAVLLSVPRAGAAHQPVFRLVPHPRLHQGMHPQAQVEAPLVRLQVPHLLLLRPVNFLHF